MIGHAFKKFGFRMAQATALASLLAVAVGGAAHAASTHNVGWVLDTHPHDTGPYKPVVSFNSAGGSVTIAREGTGTYLVEFGKLYDAPSDDVQVTAFDTSSYCVSGGWNPSGLTIEARVDCYDSSGAPADSEFTLLYQSRSGTFGSGGAGLAFLWADEPTSASYTPELDYQYNSTGGTNTILRNSVGNYTATLPGFTANGGDVLVTAYDAPARCKVGTFRTNTSTGVAVNVLCFNTEGVAADEEFDLAYALKEPFGLTTASNSHGAWAWANRPNDAASYVPPAPEQYNGFATGRLTAQKLGTGQYAVNIPGQLIYRSSTILATGYGMGADYCNTSNWVSNPKANTVYVNCYKQGGMPVDAEFDVTLQTQN
jgi:hypothetical protein